jgi:hypothetical protein
MAMKPNVCKLKTTGRAGEVAHVVEYLPSKCEALSLNPVLPKKKRKTTEK